MGLEEHQLIKKCKNGFARLKLLHKHSFTLQNIS